jgi:hypothetical protein
VKAHHRVESYKWLSHFLKPLHSAQPREGNTKDEATSAFHQSTSRLAERHALVIWSSVPEATVRTLLLYLDTVTVTVPSSHRTSGSGGESRVPKVVVSESRIGTALCLRCLCFPSSVSHHGSFITTHLSLLVQGVSTSAKPMDLCRSLRQCKVYMSVHS